MKEVEAESAGFNFTAGALGGVTGFATALAAFVTFKACNQPKQSQIEEPLL